MSSSFASANVPVEQTAQMQPRNARKTLKFPNWPEEVIHMPCKQFHDYIRREGLTKEQQTDLRKVRRREQCKRAAKLHRERNRAEAAAEAAAIEANVVGNAITRARAAADDIADQSADGPVNRILLFIGFMQKEAERLQTERDAAEMILQLAENTPATSASDVL